MNIIEYWKELSALIGIVLAYAGGIKSRGFKDKEAGADAISALQKVYDKYIEHNSLVAKEIALRVEILESQNKDLQKSFNDMALNYTNVLTESKKFEAQYTLLTKEYEQLKVDHEALKKEFDAYKKKPNK